MDLNHLIQIQYEKVKKIDNYKKTHKDTQLTHDAYRAVSLAYRTMLNFQAMQHNGNILLPFERQQLGQQMADSLELYNAWLKTSTSSPPHTKSNELVITNSNTRVHVGRAIKTIYQHIVLVETYLRKSPSDRFSQDILEMMRRAHMNIERLYDFTRAGNHLTAEQKQYIDSALQSCNHSFMKWQNAVRQGGDIYESNKTILAQQNHHGRIIQPHMYHYQGYHNQHGHSPHSRPVMWRSRAKDVVSLYATTQSAEAQSPGKTKNAVRFATDTCDAPVNPYTIDTISE